MIGRKSDEAGNTSQVRRVRRPRLRLFRLPYAPCEEADASFFSLPSTRVEGRRSRHEYAVSNGTYSEFNAGSRRRWICAKAAPRWQETSQTTTREIFRADGREESIDGPESDTKLREVLVAATLNWQVTSTQPTWRLGRKRVMVFDGQLLASAPALRHERATSLRRKCGRCAGPAPADGDAPSRCVPSSNSATDRWSVGAVVGPAWRAGGTTVIERQVVLCRIALGACTLTFRASVRVGCAVELVVDLDAALHPEFLSAARASARSASRSPS